MILCSNSELREIVAVECGNYLEHDLEDAKNQAKEFLHYIANWTVEQLKYE